MVSTIVDGFGTWGQITFEVTKSWFWKITLLVNRVEFDNIVGLDLFRWVITSIKVILSICVCLLAPTLEELYICTSY